MYDTTDVIAICTYLLDDKGDPLTGEDVRVIVFDMDNGVTRILDQIAVPEVAAEPGLYHYHYVHGFTDRRRLLVRLYYVDGAKTPTISVYQILITKDLTYYTDKIDENDGRAV